ncbi:MAG: CRTAC1 family protein [Planctomycetota bacterium]|nr:CRTAC1 family protein [Planctomycetota bacterium]
MARALPFLWLVPLLPAGLGASCGSEEAPARPTPAATVPSGAEQGSPAGDLRDEAAERGLAYVNRSGEPAKRTVLEANGPGVAVLDLGNDGDLDLVFSQGLATLGDLLRGPGADLEVFENLGGGRFERRPGPGLSGWWTGLATGDLDGDGDTDLVAGGFGGLAVLLQDEQGKLAPRQDLLEGSRDRLVPGEPRQAGEAPLWITSLALFDADGDGNLDLYAGAYVALDPVAPPVGELGEGALSVPCQWKGYKVFCGPHGMRPQADRFYRGAGDGTLFDASAKALPNHVPGYALAVANFDFEGDGDQDVYVANDSVANLLLLNDGRGVFTDVAYSAGVALSMDGRGEAGMGVAFGDVDHDLDLDFALTNFSGEPTSLYLNQKRGFRNETFRLGLQRETNALLSWSVHLEDFDGDGELELFTANGHVYPQADQPDTGTSYAQADTLWHLLVRGDERGLRRVVPTDPRSILFAPSSSRGSALGDFDGDGAPDLVVAHIDGPAALGMNRFPRGNRLVVRCLGPARTERLEADARARTPVDGSGAWVELVPKGGLPQARQVATSQGYQSASTPWLHFGLGAANEYGELNVHWPSGRVERLGAGSAGRRLVVREGKGIVSEERLP